jgi:hypothetical protein
LKSVLNERRINMNVYSVTVKNRLGKKYGGKKVHVVKNEQEAVRYSIMPGQDVQLSKQEDRVLLWSLKLEVEEPGAQAPIPIEIDSPGSYRVTVFQSDAKGKWTLEFNAPENLTASDDPPVNITIGREELPKLFDSAAKFFKR